MANTLGSEYDITCHVCGQAYAAQGWLIVDVDERPDLAAAIRAGTIHDAPCPNGHGMQLILPLLVYRPAAEPHLFFVPAPEADADQVRSHAGGLLRLLQEALGEGFRTEWIQHSLEIVDPATLAAILAEPPASADEGVAGADVPAAAPASQESPSADGTEVGQWEMVQALLGFASMPGPAFRWCMLGYRPELLSQMAADTFDFLLASLADSPELQPQREALVEGVAFLARCRELGLARAFAEATGRADFPGDPTAYGAALAEELVSASVEGRLRAVDPNCATPEMVKALARMAEQENGERQMAARQFAEALGQRDAAAAGLPDALVAQVTQVKEAEARYLAQRDASALDRAISGWDDILVHPAFAEAPTAARAGLYGDAGATYARRYSAGGAGSDLDRGLALAVRAVREAPASAATGPMLLANLGSMLRMRYEARGDGEDIEHAIAAFRGALAAASDDAPVRPGILNNLANSLRDRYQRDAQPADLDEAIGLLRLAVDLSPAGSSDLPGRLSNLGAGLSARFQASGRLPDLDAAIEALRHALAVAPEKWPGRETLLNNLGLSLRYRYERRDQAQDLQEAIAVLRQAILHTPDGSPDLPRHLNNLGGVLLVASRLPGQQATLESAVQVMRRAVELTPAGATELPRHLAALGGALQRAGEARSGADTAAWQDEVVEVLRRAVALAPDNSPEKPSYESNLGVALSQRQRVHGRVEDRIEAEAAFLNACRRSLEVDPGTAVLAAANWGNWALQRHVWPDAVVAYGYGLEALDRLLRVQAAREGKESWLRDAQRIPAAAAYARARTGDLRGAVEVLEAGRARLLGEALEQNRRDLDRLQELGQGVLLERYRSAAAFIAARQRSDEDTVSSAERAAQLAEAQADLDAAIAAMREVRGFERFFRPLDAEHIAQVAMRGGPLVYLLSTSEGGLALIVDTRGEVSALWLAELNDAAVLERVLRAPAGSQQEAFLPAYYAWRERPDDREALARWRGSLDAVTRWLWDAALGQITEALVAAGATGVSATLIATELLGLLPLHAAWVEDVSSPAGRSYVLDRLALSYAPSARALAAVLPVQEEMGAPIGEGTAESVSVLAIADPTGTLSYAGMEVTAVLDCFPSGSGRALAAGEATPEKVLAVAKSHSVLHLATHGWAGWRDALAAGVALADGQALTLGAILDLRLDHLRLAVLSACETGIAGGDLSDEVVHLGTGLLQAGVKGTVASLWAVNDLSTALLMERFYTGWQREHLAPAAALAAAQRWLRSVTAGELTQRFDVARRTSGTGRAIASLAWRRLVALPPLSTPFDHPIYWAAFTFSGR